MGCHLFSYFCSSHAPRPSLLASHRTRVCLFVSKCLFSIICLIAFFICSNHFVCSSFQSSLQFFIFSLCDCSGRRGMSYDKFGMNFCEGFTLPIIYLSCFKVFVGSIFIITSVLRVVVMIPSGLILYTNHVISVAAISHLFKLIARFSLSSLFSTLLNSVSWLVSDPSVLIFISSSVNYIFLKCCRHVC